MDKQDLRIFVVEDDKTLSKVLVEALKSQGYQAVAYLKPDDVLANIRFTVPHVFLIDCLLPKMSGVTLAQTIRDMGIQDSKIFFMSGIFKDKTFIRDSMQKVNAAGFWTKPFNLDEVIAEINKVLEPFVDSNKDVSDDPMLGLLSNPNSKPGDRLRAVETLTSIHGFEIPRTLNLLMTRSISGVLTLKPNSAEKIIIHISNGTIVRVEMKMPASLFGALLIEKNLVTPEALKPVLASQTDKPLGEKLVAANLISPHVIEIIATEQMGVRLSELIKDTAYDTSFTSTKVPPGNCSIDNYRLAPYMSDWITSKIPLKWFQTFYLPWLDHATVTTVDFNPQHPALGLSPISQMPEFVQKISAGSSINALLTDPTFKEEDVFAAVHVLIASGLVVFDPTRRAVSGKDQLERLRRLSEDLKDRTHFEILGVSTNAKPQDIKKSYHELAKTFHPDKLPPGVDPEVALLTKTIFSLMTSAYEVLRDETNRERYLKELEHGQASMVLQSESFIEEGKALLKSGQTPKALEKFHMAASLRPPTAELQLLLNWARLLAVPSGSAGAKVIQEIQNSLNKIPPEDRHTPLYYFVKGLYQKYLGELDIAAGNFKHALFLQPSFKEAERELNMNQIAKKSANKPADVLHGNLSDVITGIFKRKK